MEVRARVFVSKGNPLTGGQASGTLLTTVVKEQPMYVYCDVGTNLDMAQVLVQNRVNLAMPTLPSEVKQTGVSVKKKSPSILLVVNLTSPK